MPPETRKPSGAAKENKKKEISYAAGDTEAWWNEEPSRVPPVFHLKGIAI